MSRRLALVILVAGLGVFPTAGHASADGATGAALSPTKFAEVSTGVALIKTYGCGGRLRGTGSGFLVGSSVVMTAEHVLRGACRARVVFGNEMISAARWVFWTQGAADIGVIKLAREATGHVFRFRSSPPPFGTNLAMLGHPLGNRVSMNQGKLIRRVKFGRVPAVVVRMLGAIGASGSPFVDDQGRVVGILQLGLGGGEASGFVVGVELSTAWGKGPRRALCRAFPRGGVRGCAGTEPDPPPLPFVEMNWLSSDEAGEVSATSIALGSPARVYLQVLFGSALVTQRTVEIEWFDPSGLSYTSGLLDLPAGWHGFRYGVDLPATTVPGLWRFEYYIDGTLAGDLVLGVE